MQKLVRYRWAIALPVVLVLLIAGCSSGQIAHDRAEQYLRDRNEALAPMVETALRIENSTQWIATSGLSGLNFNDLDASSEALQTMHECQAAVPNMVDVAVPELDWDAVPGAQVFPGYRNTAAIADRDAAAVAHFIELRDVVNGVQHEAQLACSMVSALSSAHANAPLSGRFSDYPRVLDYLSFAVTDGVDLSWDIVPGSQLVNVYCDGALGCPQAELADLGDYLESDWTSAAVQVPVGYLTAYATCPFTALSAICIAKQQQARVWSADEGAIAEAFASEDGQAIAAAFADRNTHWTEQQELVDAELSAYGASSFEEALAAEWTASLQEAVGHAEQAVVTW